jgi:hypothetical protein
MKKIILFLLLGVVISCKKSETLPAGTLQVNGVLHYDKGLGSVLGLYYVTDSNKTMIFKNEFPNDTLQYLHYAIYVGFNTTLFYNDVGEGCYPPFPTLCGLPEADIVKFAIR